MVADGMGFEEILVEHPDLEMEDIREALHYAAAAVRESGASGPSVTWSAGNRTGGLRPREQRSRSELQGKSGRDGVALVVRMGLVMYGGPQISGRSADKMEQ